jgi:cytosine/adenosine deaminase-related metal-dependent hydrolase
VKYLFCFVIVFATGLGAVQAYGMEYDLAINHGRVMDPETGFDKIAHVGILDGVIRKISATPLEAKQRVNAAGLVVAPGFIDLHAHGQDARSAYFQVADGVTTTLELEIGVLPVDKWLEQRAGKSRTHFGATAGHLSARLKTLAGVELVNPVYASENARNPEGVDFATSQLQPQQLHTLQQMVSQGITQGGLGIGIGVTYAPGASHEEILSMFQVAADFGVPVFVHMRNARQMGNDLLAPLQEVLANAAATGASLHVVHINSSLNEDVRIAMQMIRGAVARGIDVTTESYPYTAGSTRLESALFDDYQGDFNQLQWTATGERLTRETFGEYRKQGGWVIIHGRNEFTNTWVVAQPDIMIASDGVPFVGDFSHPRSAGTYARVLGHYVRDEQALTLMTALQKMTFDPARRLQDFAPAMARKGRVQEGADADLTLFDPLTVLDQATYTLPARTSAGIAHVIVAGQFVVRDGEVREDVFPGRAIRGEGRARN